MPRFSSLDNGKASRPCHEERRKVGKRVQPVVHSEAAVTGPPSAVPAPDRNHLATPAGPELQCSEQSSPLECQLPYVALFFDSQAAFQRAPALTESPHLRKCPMCRSPRKVFKPRVADAAAVAISLVSSTTSSNYNRSTPLQVDRQPSHFWDMPGLKLEAFQPTSFRKCSG